MWILSPLLSGTVCKICNYLCWADSERVLLLNAILGDKVIKLFENVCTWSDTRASQQRLIVPPETPVHSNVELRCLKYVWRIFGNKRVRGKINLCSNLWKNSFCFDPSKQHTAFYLCTDPQERLRGEWSRRSDWYEPPALLLQGWSAGHRLVFSDSSCFNRAGL